MIIQKKWSMYGLIISLFLFTLSVFFILSIPEHLPYYQVLNLPKNHEQKPVVVILPHQDDEMFLAGTLNRLIKRGHPVYTIVTTDGSGSAVRYILSGRDRNGNLAVSIIKKRILNPIIEGYKPLDKQHFSAARNREYFESMQNLGVPANNILFANPGGIMGSNHPIYIDGSMTKELAREIIQRIYHKIGNGIYLVVASAHDETIYQNIDHKAIEEALKEFPGIDERYYFGDKEYPALTIFLSPEEHKNKVLALNAYKIWNPQQGRFAIGEHSVKHMLDYWRKSTKEYMIPDPSNKERILNESVASHNFIENATRR